MPMNINFVMNPMYMNMGMQNMNNEDDEWLKGFKLGVDEVNNPGGGFDDTNEPGPKININFTTTIGKSHNLKFKYGTTVSQALRRYLEFVGREQYFGHNEKINFLYNAKRIEYNDNTNVENFFRNAAFPKIVVNDTQGLIGA